MLISRHENFTRERRTMLDVLCHALERANRDLAALDGLYFAATHASVTLQDCGHMFKHYYADGDCSCGEDQCAWTPYCHRCVTEAAEKRETDLRRELRGAQDNLSAQMAITEDQKANIKRANDDIKNLNDSVEFWMERAKRPWWRRWA
jgi:hypothetical protein